MKELVRHLKINGKLIHFTTKEGIVWIAIKPICEALGANFNNQFKALKKDQVLGPEVSKMQFRYPGDQRRVFICLPEKFIYGWLFSVRSRIPSFQIYKWKCYELLFEHFHGSLTERKNVLLEKAELKERENELKRDLKNNPHFVQLNDIIGKELRIGKALKKLDEELVDSKLEFPLPSFLS